MLLIAQYKFALFIILIKCHWVLLFLLKTLTLVFIYHRLSVQYNQH